MLQDILKSTQDKINLVGSLNELQQIKIELFGKKGSVNQAMQKISSLEESERKIFGQQINELKQELSRLIEQKFAAIEQETLNKRFIEEELDLTMPARPRKIGTIHPISQALDELVQIFSQFGFSAKYGPSIESEWYNFTALNIDENHPARQMHDTFYLNESRRVLRTHTSPIQIRSMQSAKPPLRIIAPGRTYRSDSDLTHTPMFHQIEGLVIDRNINMGHLKYVMIKFIRNFFEQNDLEIRFRPSFFPFTEPSAEIDIRLGGSDKWLEVLGCGMVHSQVLKNVDIDPDEYQGFAFGLGIERLAMLKYNIKDLRQFFDSDLRWLKHYNFSAFDIPTLASGLTK